MIRKIFGSETLAASEEAAIQRLADAHAGLWMDGTRLNTKTELAYAACSAFLVALDNAARILRVDPAPRNYRSSFTINYRALYPDEERNYRVDVLEASAEQSAVIWVNGEKFEFSAVVMRCAEALINNWTETGKLLERWRLNRRTTKSELKASLRLLDVAWADFEHRYIEELILIEEKARKLVVESIHHEKALSQMEANDSQFNAEYFEERSKLIKCMCKLNSVANHERKGRDDLKPDILDDALALMKSCENPPSDVEFDLISEDVKLISRSGTMTAGESKKQLQAEERKRDKADGELSAAKCLAVDVDESYWHMRYYLRDISQCLERVDPHLCNNAGLVSHLVDWEESWEVGRKYVQNTQMLRAVCHLVSYLKGVEKVEEGLTKMIEDYDVEFIMLLPRLVWLRFLTDPSRHLDLLRSFLPHHFADENSRWDKDVQEVINSYEETYSILLAQVGSHSDAQRFLVQRVIAGPNCEQFYQSKEIPNLVPKLSTNAVEDLIQKIEKNSIELQRHCPEDWNQYMALTMRCFAGQQKPREHHFRV